MNLKLPTLRCITFHLKRFKRFLMAFLSYCGIITHQSKEMLSTGLKTTLNQNILILYNVCRRNLVERAIEVYGKESLK